MLLLLLVMLLESNVQCWRRWRQRLKRFFEREKNGIKCEYQLTQKTPYGNGCDHVYDTRFVCESVSVSARVEESDLDKSHFLLKIKSIFNAMQTAVDAVVTLMLSLSCFAAVHSKCSIIELIVLWNATIINKCFTQNARETAKEHKPSHELYGLLSFGQFIKTFGVRCLRISTWTRLMLIDFFVSVRFFGPCLGCWTAENHAWNSYNCTIR